MSESPGRTFGDVEEEAVTPDTIYSDLRSELAVPVKRENVERGVPGRNVRLVFATDIEFDLLREWSKRAVRGKGANKEMNELALCTTVLLSKCIEIKMKGQTVEYDGSPITLTHAMFLDMFGLKHGPGSAQKSLRMLYGDQDGAIIQHGQAVLEGAGYGEEDYGSDTDYDYGEDPGPLGD